MDSKIGRNIALGIGRGAVISLGLVLLMALVAPSPAIAARDIVSCSKRIAKGLKSFSSSTAEILGDCEIDDLEDDEIFLDCAQDEDVLADRYKANSKLWREVRKCGAAAVRAVCPLGAKTLDELSVAVEQSPSGPGLFFENLMACLLYTSPSPRDKRQSRMPSSA